jgi:exosome complex component CSL4
VIFMSEKILLPGEYVGPGEVYAEGATTYASGDEIFAAAVGHADESSGTVKTRISKPSLKEGDIVYGTVIMVMDSFAIVVIYPERKAGVLPAAPPEGKIPVRSMSQGFTRMVRDAFRIGDIIRARVVMIEGEKAELTTRDPELGVIKAFCSVCRKPLENKGGSSMLSCPDGHRETRKTAADYRKYGDIPI